MATGGTARPARIAPARPLIGMIGARVATLLNRVVSDRTVRTLSCPAISHRPRSVSWLTNDPEVLIPRHVAAGSRL